MKFIGIDYGSKLAGTTAICWNDGGLRFLQSETGKDADRFILEFIYKHYPRQIFIDAPLSLPLAYRDNTADDFFYRRCDREVNAMSPMFIGGLTARAIKLKRNLESSGIRLFESYPGGLARQLANEIPGLAGAYKTDLETFSCLISSFFGVTIESLPSTWHQADAMLAWLIGLRYEAGLHLEIGDPEEGVIFV
ncbi:MAG: hypothetical protein ACLFPE_11525 [Bacteroidales bacterium]